MSNSRKKLKEELVDNNAFITIFYYYFILIIYFIIYLNYYFMIWLNRCKHHHTDVSFKKYIFIYFLTQHPNFSQILKFQTIFKIKF